MLFLTAFLTSLLLVVFFTPAVIRVAHQKRLFDSPLEKRKVHKEVIPNLGGVAIVTSVLIVIALFAKFLHFTGVNFLFASCLIIFMTGIKDDIIGVDPIKKFAAQFIAAAVIVIMGDIRFTDLSGLVGFGHLAYPFSIGLSIFFIVGITNAYNLIDGIDGLAGGLGLLFFLLFAYMFYCCGEAEWVTVCLAIAGGLIGFLIYNFSPAKIFMGDCGSLILGFFAAVISIKFINISLAHPIYVGNRLLHSPIAIPFAAMVLPAFDTIRVFVLRIAKNKSPFEADRNHIHHRLLSVGLNHIQSTLILVITTIASVAIALSFQSIGHNQLISTILIFVIMFNSTLNVCIYRYQKIKKEKKLARLDNVKQLKVTVATENKYANIK